MCDELFNKSCIELYEAVRGRLIGPKSWDRIVIILKPQMDSPCSSRTFCDGYDGNYVLNHVLVWMRPGMAVKCGFTK